MGISFGPGGNSESWGKRKFPEQLPEYLASLGLNGYEIECGRGVRLSEKTQEYIKDHFSVDAAWKVIEKDFTR